MSTGGYHPPLEEYLETIHDLGEEGTPVIQARVAERLGRSAPSVSEMLERLHAEGYVRRSGRRLELTGKGRSVAERVVRKHRLAERLLVDVIGLEWHKAHLEAGRWEHVISDEVEERLVALLGNPSTCPHGNPIPGAPPAVGPEQTCLADVLPETSVRVERITEEIEVDMSALRFLDDHGLVPGRQATVHEPRDDGTLVVQIGDAMVDVPPAMAKQLFVVTEVVATTP